MLGKANDLETGIEIDIQLVIQLVYDMGVVFAKMDERVNYTIDVQAVPTSYEDSWAKHSFVIGLPNFTVFPLSRLLL